MAFDRLQTEENVCSCLLTANHSRVAKCIGVAIGTRGGGGRGPGPAPPSLLGSIGPEIIHVSNILLFKCYIQNIPASSLVSSVATPLMC